MKKHQFDMRKEVLFKTGKKRGFGNLFKTAEVTEFLAEIKEKDEQGIGRNRKDLLKDESR